MITSKELAEKIHMFYNLLYHLDDYIKNKKERKGQLHLNKNIRLVLREVISSKANIKYFIAKEEIDSFLSGLFDKKVKLSDINLEEKALITPLSFNQKNMDTVNLFFNAKNEMFILKYIIIEKIFSIIRFCFLEKVKKKKNEFIKNFEKKYRNNFALTKIGENSSFFSTKATQISPSKNIFLRNTFESKKIEEFETFNPINSKETKNIKAKKFFYGTKKDDINNRSYASFSMSSINNNYNCNNIILSQGIKTNNNFNNNKDNLLKNLRRQVKKIENKIKLSQIKEKENNSFNKLIKKNPSLPSINLYKNIAIEKYNKKNKKFEESRETLISENKIEVNNIIKNIMNTKKINHPQTTLFKNFKKIKFQNKFDKISNYDYKNVLPLFKIPKKNKKKDL